MKMEKKEHLLWPDVLKIISIYAVILLHSAAPLLVRYHRIGETDWWIGNLYDSLSRWCIPLFIMLSGAMLLGKTHENSLGVFFKKRFWRVAVPFLIWSVLYFLWRIYVKKEELALSSFFPLFFTGPLYYHLWFLYLIIGLYMLTPVLSLYLSCADRTNVLYFLALWFIMDSILPFAESLSGIKVYLSTGAATTVFKFVGYFVLGYFLRSLQLRPLKIVLFLFLFLLAFFITAYGTYYVTVRKNAGIFDGIFYEYFNFNVFLMSVSVYLIGKSIKYPAFLLKCEGRFGMFRAIAACVPGIYLIHAMLIEAAKKGMPGFTFSQDILPPAAGIPVFALGIFLAALLIIFIVKKLPVIKHIVP